MIKSKTVYVLGTLIAIISAVKARGSRIQTLRNQAGYDTMASEMFDMAEYVDNFLRNFLKIDVSSDKSPLTTKFKLSNFEYSIIYINSFKEDNQLGNYQSCKLLNYSYINYVFLDNDDYDDAFSKGMVNPKDDNSSYPFFTYYQDLMFFKYLSFCLCLPPKLTELPLNRTFIDIKNDPFKKYLNYPESSYIVNIYNITHIEEERKSNSIAEYAKITILVLSIFLIMLSIIIMLIPSYEFFLKIKRNYYATLKNLRLCCTKINTYFKEHRKTNSFSSSSIETNNEEYIGEIVKKGSNENNHNSKPQNYSTFLITKNLDSGEKHPQLSRIIEEEESVSSFPRTSMKKGCCEKFYDFLKFTYDFKENMKRIMKPSSIVVDDRSSEFQINDNDFMFINGIRALLMFSFLMTTVFWYSLECPLSFFNKSDSFKLFNKHYMLLPIMYWLTWSIIIPCSINSFVMAYKFLSFHEKYYSIYKNACISKFMSNGNNESSRNSSDSFKQVDIPKLSELLIHFKIFLRFFAMQFYRYLTFIILFYLVYCLDWIVGYNQNGPYLYLYNDMKKIAIENQLSIFLVYENLLVNFFSKDSSSRHATIYFCFFQFLNEIYFCLYAIIVLSLYQCKKILMLVILLSLYLASLVGRSVMIQLDDLYLRSVIGFDIKNTHPLYYLSILHLGIIFGIIMFEYNKSQISNHDLENDDFVDMIYKENNSVEMIDQSSINEFKTIKPTPLESNEVTKKPKKKKNLVICIEKDKSNRTSDKFDKATKKSKISSGKSPKGSTKKSKNSKFTDSLKIHNFIRKYFVDKSNRYLIQIVFGVLTTILIACIAIDCKLFLVRIDELFDRSGFEFNLKLYYPLEIETLILLMFFLIFKFVILKKSIFSTILEKKSWIIFSRCSIIMYFLAPPTINVLLLNLSGFLKFEIFSIILIFLTSLLLLLLFAIIILLLVDLPLKLAFRRIVRSCFLSSASPVNSM